MGRDRYINDRPGTLARLQMDERGTSAPHEPFAPEDDSDSVVLPALTLPTLKRVALKPDSSARHRRPHPHDPRLAFHGEESWPQRYPSGSPSTWTGSYGQPTPARRTVASRPTQSDLERIRAAHVDLVPARSRHTRSAARWLTRSGQTAARAITTVTRHRAPLAVLALVLVLVSVIANTAGTVRDASRGTESQWRSIAGIGPLIPPGPPPAPEPVGPHYYMDKYGFDTPTNIQRIADPERDRLIVMLPWAVKATAAYNKRYKTRIEPQLLLWWTHAEGIKARINFSNCSSQRPRPGTSYFTNIENCSHASFWQLGYGNQFSEIYVLKNAFRDLYGDPNDAQLVRKVGQWVLDYDRKIGTTPPCGGYSCTFPARTIDSILSGIDMTPGKVVEDNWWASVLSRDPGINSYMIARALAGFNRAATKRWLGCYYQEPCWGSLSNRLGDILVAWPDLRKAARV